MCKEIDNVQRVTDFETHSPKWDVFVKHLPLELRELCRTGGRSVGARGDGCHQGTSILQTQKYCQTCYLKSSTAASTGHSLAQVDKIPA